MSHAACPPFAPVAVFDLDGTLVDSAADIAHVINQHLTRHGLEPLALKDAASLMGNGARSFARRAFALRGASISEAEIDAFITAYSQFPVTDARLYPDCEAVLSQLTQEGWRLAVCTNKIENASRHILAGLGILSRFESVCGGDTVPAHKPDGQHLLAALTRIGADTAHAVMIGDHANDIATARANHVPCIFAGWGYGELASDPSPDPGRQAHHPAIKPHASDSAVIPAQSFAELPALLRDLRARMPLG